MARVLLLLPTTTYRASDFLAAAEKLGLEVTVGSERPSTLENLNPAGLITLPFGDRDRSTEAAVDFARSYPVDAVIGVDEETAVAAASIAAALGLPHNPVEAVATARNKARLRAALTQSGVPSPHHWLFHRTDDPRAPSKQVTYPCVLKPTFLSASRGVIRADDPNAFVRAWKRIEKILDEPDVREKGGGAAEEILVEEFVPGEEVAVEGLLRNGALTVLAIFDKPDPLEGPYFEETIYVTPSRKPPGLQSEIAGVTAAACRALGLRDGPVHAELRCAPDGVRLIEIAARSIGGLCSRVLRFGAAMSLEELILRHALGQAPPEPGRERQAAGVMMIPIPKAGVLEEVGGLEEARTTAGIEEVTISAHPGQRLVPLPEGSRYLGFIFSRADTPERAEAALREAHRRLEFRIGYLAGE
ncbi:MAG: ATP-grasp domain-containing protein [Thermoanaerobaculia bacterium]